MNVPQLRDALDRCGRAARKPMYLYEGKGVSIFSRKVLPVNKFQIDNNLLQASLFSTSS
jgi:hypothetical protein